MAYIKKPKNLELTPAELTVAQHVMGGFTDKEIARILDNSERTIQSHRLQIRKKWNACSRRQIVLGCRERGIEAV